MKATDEQIERVRGFIYLYATRRLAEALAAVLDELAALRKLAAAVRTFDAAWGTGGGYGAAERFAAWHDVQAELAGTPSEMEPMTATDEPL